MSNASVLKFSAVWCGPCRMYAPTFARVAATRPDLDFVSIDVDEDNEAAQRFAVSSVPTTILVKDGQEVARVNGAQSTNRLGKFLNDNL